MDLSLASDLLLLQLGALLVILLSFVAWFRTRDTRAGDLACIVLATLAFGLLTLASRSLRKVPCLGGLAQLPGALAYLSFLGLWFRRRTQVRMRQWARKNGFRIVAVERLYSRGYGQSFSTGPDLKILARGLKDRTMRVGWVFLSPLGFQVQWSPEPPPSLGRHPAPRNRSTGPIPPNGGTPPTV